VAIGSYIYGHGSIERLNSLRFNLPRPPTDQRSLALGSKIHSPHLINLVLTQTVRLDRTDPTFPPISTIPNQSRPSAEHPTDYTRLHHRSTLRQSEHPERRRARCCGGAATGGTKSHPPKHPQRVGPVIIQAEDEANLGRGLLPAMEMTTGQATMKGGPRWRTNLRREIVDDSTDSALDLVSGELQQCPVTLNSHAPRPSNGMSSYCPRRRAVGRRTAPWSHRV
jgi:hypothetical protein